MIVIAATVLAGSMMSSAVLAKDSIQIQLVSPTALAVTKSLSLKVFVPKQVAPRYQPGSVNMAGWLQLREQTRSGGTGYESDTCHNQTARGQSGLCKVQWHHHDGLSGSRKRFENYSYETNRSFVKHLANHLEIDIGRSPSISLRYDFY